MLSSISNKLLHLLLLLFDFFSEQSEAFIVKRSLLLCFGSGCDVCVQHVAVLDDPGPVSYV